MTCGTDPPKGLGEGTGGDPCSRAPASSRRLHSRHTPAGHGTDRREEAGFRGTASEGPWVATGAPEPSTLPWLRPAPCWSPQWGWDQAQAGIVTRATIRKRPQEGPGHQTWSKPSDRRGPGHRAVGRPHVSADPLPPKVPRATLQNRYRPQRTADNVSPSKVK